jgi:hypothetical protein
MHRRIVAEVFEPPHRPMVRGRPVQSGADVGYTDA